MAKQSTFICAKAIIVLNRRTVTAVHIIVIIVIIVSLLQSQRSTE
jgi:hypothetical protein